MHKDPRIWLNFGIRWGTIHDNLYSFFQLYNPTSQGRRLSSPFCNDNSPPWLFHLSRLNCFIFSSRSSIFLMATVLTEIFFLLHYFHLTTNDIPISWTLQLLLTPQDLPTLQIDRMNHWIGSALSLGLFDPKPGTIQPPDMYCRPSLLLLIFLVPPYTLICNSTRRAGSGKAGGRTLIIVKFL